MPNITIDFETQEQLDSFLEQVLLDENFEGTIVTDDNEDALELDEVITDLGLDTDGFEVAVED